MNYELGAEVQHEEDDIESENIPPSRVGNESTRFDQHDNHESPAMDSDVDKVPEKSSDATVHDLRYVVRREMK
jgi:hypothetical protein